jgi:hypothetical protein
MAWTCSNSEFDCSEPFDPPRETSDGEPICEKCDSEAA